jgi:tripartite-type tricarboxylate transporter receptor subunit TctC
LGRAIAAPPDIPNDRLEILRKAMLQAMKDPEFVEEAGKANVDMEVMDAADTAKVANQLFATPEEAVARIRATTVAP